MAIGAIQRGQIFLTHIAIASDRTVRSVLSLHLLLVSEREELLILEDESVPHNASNPGNWSPW